jgi:hypothetical protein
MQYGKQRPFGSCYVCRPPSALPIITGVTLDHIRPADRSQIEELLAGAKWSLPGDHPIAALDGLALGDHRVTALLGPKNAVGSRYFQLYLSDARGRLAEGLLALGLHNSGPFPAFNWVELTQFQEQLRFGRATLDLWETGLERTLFAALGALVPAGGHMMAEYDSPSHRATERILTLRYPQVCSPIGYLMFEAGARSYRDWYISEGGREGPRKLQAFKPLNRAIAREKTAALRAELEAALAAPENVAHAEWGHLARELGAKALATIHRKST